MMSILQLKAQRDNTAIDWRSLAVGTVLQPYKQKVRFTVVSVDADKLMLQEEGKSAVPMHAPMADFAFSRGLYEVMGQKQ